MKVYSVGPDEAYDVPEEDENLEWIVYWYQHGSYDGWGEAVGLRKEDGKLVVANLGHCSCSGPFDGGLHGDKCTVEEYLRDKDDIMSHDGIPEIKAKVRELLKESKHANNRDFNGGKKARR